ncbi:MAG: Ref family recombination enhancement nuclease [Pikeienuella sp.]
MNLSGKGPLGLKEPIEGRDPKRLAAVAALPCCICSEWGFPQNSHTQVHHCIMGRYGTKRAPDRMTIPLCEGHHVGLMDISKIALHRSRKAWRESYGNDTDWISWTDERIATEGNEANEP